MFNISDNKIITVSRGDSFALDVFVNIGTPWDETLYTLQGEDKLYFALCEPNQPFEFALIRKVFTKDDVTEDGLVHMEFTPEMTEYIMPGTYYYTIKLVTNDGDISTIISKTKFYIID